MEAEKTKWKPMGPDRATTYTGQISDKEEVKYQGRALAPETMARSIALDLGGMASPEWLVARLKAWKEAIEEG
jgi:hypothetical protein